VIALNQLTHAHFEPYVGQAFQCSDGKNSCPLTLAKVRKLAGGRAGAPREPFALDFEGVPTLRIPQGIYRVEHPQLGTMEIFIVQTGASATASHFEVIFN
jgi:hypothetical protein